MLGAIIGDIVGSPYEWHNIKTTEFPLFCNKSRFTDDTVMTIAVACGLHEGLNNPEHSREAVIRAMHDYGSRYPRAGYGGKFRVWLQNKDPKPYGSYGNGSAMRVSAAAWFYDSLPEVLQYAEISAAVSHNHPEGIKGAQAVAAAIFLARKKHSMEDIATYITQHFGYDLSIPLDDIRPHYHFDSSCKGSVPQAIRAFLESESFEDALRKAVSIGGDSDTIAAIAGSIAEAYYRSIPEWIRDTALECLGSLQTDLNALLPYRLP